MSTTFPSPSPSPSPAPSLWISQHPALSLAISQHDQSSSALSISRPRSNGKCMETEVPMSTIFPSPSPSPSPFSHPRRNRHRDHHLYGHPITQHDPLPYPNTITVAVRFPYLSLTIPLAGTQLPLGPHQIAVVASVSSTWTDTHTHRHPPVSR